MSDALTFGDLIQLVDVYLEENEGKDAIDGVMKVMPSLPVAQLLDLIDEADLWDVVMHETVDNVDVGKDVRYIFEMAIGTAVEDYFEDTEY